MFKILHSSYRICQPISDEATRGTFDPTNNAGSDKGDSLGQPNARRRNCYLLFRLNFTELFNLRRCLIKNSPSQMNVSSLNFYG